MPHSAEEHSYSGNNRTVGTSAYQDAPTQCDRCALCMGYVPFNRKRQSACAYS